VSFSILTHPEATCSLEVHLMDLYLQEKSIRLQIHACYTLFLCFQIVKQDLVCI
jgi:hypothetical protein